MSKSEPKPPQLEQIQLQEHPPFPGEAIERVEQAVTPMELLQLAMREGAGLDKLEKLLDLQERFEKREAQKAFVKAMNEFKKNPPRILKSHTAAFPGKNGGSVSYDYATLNDVCDKITESLGTHGISHRWKVEQPEKALIRVTCILTHEMGHSEETALSAGPDETGSKNLIQSLGSTVTYLQRYTLLAATGLAAGNDNDGQTSGEPPFPKLNEFIKAIGECPNVTALDTLFKEAYKEASLLKAFGAMRTLTNAKDAKKKILNGGAA